MIAKIFLVSLIFSSVGWGYDLFELHKRRYTRITKLLPNRLYAVKEPTLGRSVLRLTDGKGELSREGEGLMVGSVLDGKWIGGDPGKRYRLESSGIWKETDQPEDHYFWRAGPVVEYYHRKLSSK